jgi:hypothetical protein
LIAGRIDRLAIFSLIGISAPPLPRAAVALRPTDIQHHDLIFDACEFDHPARRDP